MRAGGDELVDHRSGRPDLAPLARAFNADERGAGAVLAPLFSNAAASEQDRAVLALSLPPQDHAAAADDDRLVEGVAAALEQHCAAVALLVAGQPRDLVDGRLDAGAVVAVTGPQGDLGWHLRYGDAATHVAGMGEVGDVVALCVCPVDEPASTVEGEHFRLLRGV